MKTLSFSHHVGQMQCKSDKYDTVYSTMGKYLNEGINSMLESDGKTPKYLNIYSMENNNGGNLDFYIMPQGLNDIYKADDQYQFHTREPSNQIKITITGDMAFYVHTFVWLWNYLRLSLLQPKFDTVKDHLVHAFWLWHAIGPHNEEFTESDHDKDNAKSQIFGALRDAQSREEVVSKRAVIMENPEVQALQQKRKAEEDVRQPK